MFYNLGEKTIFLIMTQNPGYIKLKIDKFNHIKIKQNKKHTKKKALKKKKEKEKYSWQ